MKSWTTNGKIERAGEVVLEMVEVYLTERQDAAGRSIGMGASIYLSARMSNQGYIASRFWIINRAKLLSVRLHPPAFMCLEKLASKELVALEYLRGRTP